MEGSPRAQGGLLGLRRARGRAYNKDDLAQITRHLEVTLGHLLAERNDNGTSLPCCTCESVLLDSCFGRSVTSIVVEEDEEGGSGPNLLTM